MDKCLQSHVFLVRSGATARGSADSAPVSGQTEKVRVYIPADFRDIAQALSGEWTPTLGFAVTTVVAEAVSAIDPDEIAEQVKDHAAQQSLAIDGNPRRLVVVADYSRADLIAPSGEGSEHPAAVGLSGRLSPDMIACFFVDDDAAIAEINAYRASGADADTYDRLYDHELLWYDISESAAFNA